MIGATSTVWRFALVGICVATFGVSTRAWAGPDPEFPMINPFGSGTIQYHEDTSLRYDPHDGDSSTSNPEFRAFVPRSNMIKVGYYQRWMWCGTSCWLVINDADHEVMLIDGYVSKADVGQYRTFTYEPSEWVDSGSGVLPSAMLKRIMRLSNFLRWLTDPLQHPDLGAYSFVGILSLHDHMDHVGDLQYLKIALGITEGERLYYTVPGSNSDDCPSSNGGNGEFTDGECDAVSSSNVLARYAPFDRTSVPIIGHWSYYLEGDYGNPVLGDDGRLTPFTHALKERHPEGDFCGPLINRSPDDVGDDKTWTQAGGLFTGRASIHKVKVDGSLGLALPCENCGTTTDDASLELGQFAIQVFQWDHQTLPIIHGGQSRTFAFRIWHAEAPDARRSFITGSAGDVDPYALSDSANDYWLAHFDHFGAKPAGYNHRFETVMDITGGSIGIDAAFYAMASNGFQQWNGGDDAALLATRLKFYDRGGAPGYVIANHLDDNDNTEETTEELIRSDLTAFMDSSLKIGTSVPHVDCDRRKWANGGECMEHRLLPRFFLEEPRESDGGPADENHWLNRPELIYARLSACEDGCPGINPECNGADSSWNATDPNDRFGFGIVGSCGDGVVTKEEDELCEPGVAPPCGDSVPHCKDIDKDGGLMPCTNECKWDDSVCSEPTCDALDKVCCNVVEDLPDNPSSHNRSSLAYAGVPDGNVPGYYCKDQDGFDSEGQFVCIEDGPGNHLCKPCGSGASGFEGCACSRYGGTCQSPLNCIGEICVPRADNAGPQRDWQCDAPCFSIYDGLNPDGPKPEGGYCQPDGEEDHPVVFGGQAFCGDSRSSRRRIFECRADGLIAINDGCKEECSYDKDPANGCSTTDVDDEARAIAACSGIGYPGPGEPGKTHLCQGVDRGDGRCTGVCVPIN